MSADELAHILSILDAPADEADRLKRRGFYVDMDRARQAAASGTSILLGPDVQARLANPPAEAVELIQELVSALTEAGPARTPQAATDVILQAVGTFRAHKGAT